MHHHADAHLKRREAAVLRRLRLTRFRNFTELDWRPASGWNRVEAPNGAGKTSLLEAIYLAATGRSFRAADVADCRQHSAAPVEPEELAAAPQPKTAQVTRVSAEIERDGALWELGATLSDDGRTRTVQGKAASLAEQLELLPLAVWGEGEQELVRGADGVRRRFLDRAALLLEPASAAREAEHARAWRQKRHLLAQGRAAAGLRAWNELLAPHLVRRAAVREALVAALEREANALLSAHASDLAELRLVYRPSPGAVLEGEAAALAALAEKETGERERRVPLVGPQRDRVAIALGDEGTRRFASRGEQKLVGLALVAALAHLLVAHSRSPLVLLDDLESELDAARTTLAESLFAGLPQVVATGSRERPEGGFPGRRWRLGAGTINLLDS